MNLKSAFRIDCRSVSIEGGAGELGATGAAGVGGTDSIIRLFGVQDGKRTAAAAARIIRNVRAFMQLAETGLPDPLVFLVFDICIAGVRPVLLFVENPLFLRCFRLVLDVVGGRFALLLADAQDAGLVVLIDHFRPTAF